MKDVIYGVLVNVGDGYEVIQSDHGAFDNSKFWGANKTRCIMNDWNPAGVETCSLHRINDVTDQESGESFPTDNHNDDESDVLNDDRVQVLFTREMTSRVKLGVWDRQQW